MRKAKPKKRILLPDPRFGDSLVTRFVNNLMRYGGKAKSRFTKAGYLVGRTNSYKKAIITLKEGEKIDFYSNI